MNNLRRVLALVVVFAMVLGSTVAFAAAPTFSDLDDASQKVVGVLASMSIIQGYEDGTFKGDQTITRAEFAAVVARMLGMESSAKNQVPTIFTDVPQSHWASGYVAAATGKNNIIAGYGDGTFGPENPVKYEEAVKMLVCALGYEPQAADEGGYPTGHLFVAQKIDLLADANGYAGTDATRMTVAQLCFNALDIPLMERSVWGGNTPVYEIFDGTNGLARKTIMSEYLGLIKLAGVVTKNENTDTNMSGLVAVSITDNYSTKYSSDSRYASGTTDEPNVSDFKVGDTNAKDYIGMSVVFFATYESNKSVDPTIMFIDEETSKGKVVVDFENLKSSETLSESVAVTYYTDKDNNKSTKLYIPKDNTAAIFVNGVKVDKTGEELSTAIAADAAKGQFNDLNGSIEFVSTSSKGSVDYNSIFITIYDNFLVDEVNATNYKIVAAEESPYTSTITFDPDDRDILTTIKDENGAAVDPTTLEQYDVLTMKVFNSKTLFAEGSNAAKEVYDCTLVRKTVSGTVTETDDADDVVVIDGTEYKLDPSASSLSVKIQDTGIFYLDAVGKIIAFMIDPTNLAGNYAVLLYVDPAEDGINSPRVKLLMPDGTITTKYLASRVKVPTYDPATFKYGSKTVDGKDLASDVAADYDLNNPDAKPNEAVAMVCTYKENANGQINSLFFSLDNEVPADATAKQSYSKEVYNAGHLMTNIFAAANGTIRAENTTEKSLRVNGTTYWFNDRTVVINIDRNKVKDDEPVVKGWSDVTDSEVSLLDVSSLGYDQELEEAVVYVFDADASGHPRFVVIDGKADMTDPSKAVALAKNYRDAQNADGEDVVKVNAYTTLETALQPYTFASDLGTSNTPSAGEAFVPVSFNAAGEVKKVDVLTSVSFEDQTVALNAGVKASSNDVEYIYGTVLRKSSSTLYIANELNKDEDGVPAEDSVIVPNSMSVMECDLRLPKDNAIKLRSTSDIELSKPVGDDPAVPMANDISAYKVLIRIYKGKVEDAVLYILPKLK